MTENSAGKNESQRLAERNGRLMGELLGRKWFLANCRRPPLKYVALPAYARVFGSSDNGPKDLGVQKRLNAVLRFYLWPNGGHAGWNIPRRNVSTRKIGRVYIISKRTLHRFRSTIWTGGESFWLANIPDDHGRLQWPVFRKCFGTDSV